MTKDEWLACDDAQAMIEYLARAVKRQWTGPTRRLLSRKSINRKLRLFFCGRCRVMWGDLTDQRSRKAVETAEQFADGLVGRSALRAARLDAYRVAKQPTVSSAELLAYWATWLDVLMLARHEHCEWDEQLRELNEQKREPPGQTDVANLALQLREAVHRERVAQAAMLHDLFGNPFRPVESNRSWLTQAIVGLARKIYDAGAFDRLPALADKLEAAGCPNGAIVGHCRSGNRHMRGCWLLDLLLAKG
jgi:hypothetical protein